MITTRMNQRHTNHEMNLAQPQEERHSAGDTAQGESTQSVQGLGFHHSLDGGYIVFTLQCFQLFYLMSKFHNKMLGETNIA